MTELLPCPFCLKTPKEVDYMGFKWAECLTNDCALFDQMIKAKAWNTRADKSPSPDAERLAEPVIWRLKAIRDLANGKGGTTEYDWNKVWHWATEALADFEKGGLK